MYFFGCAFFFSPFEESKECLSTFTYDRDVTILVKMRLIVCPESCKKTEEYHRIITYYQAIKYHDTENCSLCSGDLCSFFLSKTDKMWDIENGKIEYRGAIFLYSIERICFYFLRYFCE